MALPPSSLMEVWPQPTVRPTVPDGYSGGGIAARFRSKLRALEEDFRGAGLPGVSAEELSDWVAEALGTKGGRPLTTFARDTWEAIMVDSFQEFALKGTHAIQQWLERVEQGGGVETPGTREATEAWPLEDPAWSLYSPV